MLLCVRVIVFFVFFCYNVSSSGFHVLVCDWLPWYFAGSHHMGRFHVLSLYFIETPFNIFANRADPDQAALVRAA